MRTVYALFSAMKIDVLQALGFTITTEENAEFELPALHLIAAEREKIAPHNLAVNAHVRIYRMCSETFYRLHIELPNGLWISATTDLDRLLCGLGSEEEPKAMMNKWNI